MEAQQTLQTQTQTQARLDAETFDVSAVRHVIDDDGSYHLVAHDDTRFAMCGSGAGGLRHFGDDVTTTLTAAQLGAWVNCNDQMCEECREAFNDAVWETVDAQREDR